MLQHGAIFRAQLIVTEDEYSQNLTHKEETIGRIISDALNKKSPRQTLSKCTCSDPLGPKSHSDDDLVNIVPGAVAPTNVNIDRSLRIIIEHMKYFKSSWHDGFYSQAKDKLWHLL